jgi:hypothetical protein
MQKGKLKDNLFLGNNPLRTKMGSKSSLMELSSSQKWGARSVINFKINHFKKDKENSLKNEGAEFNKPI